MARYRSLIVVMVVMLGAVLLCSRSFAQQPGINGTEIKLGSCAALDGPARQLGVQTVLGATTYFNYLNDRGGINGRKVHLVALDDGYDPERATACFDNLKKQGIFAAGFFVGTPTAAKYVPLAQEDKIPVVGLFTGAQLLYEPLKRYIINVRASYYDETREQIDGLWGAGIKKVGVIYQDDAFGQAVLAGVKLALTKHKAAPVALGTFERNTLNVDKGMETVMKEKPEAVVLVGPYAPVARILKDAHSRNWHPLFLTVSFVGTEALINAAGSDADGVVITQVVPPYDRTDLATVKLYRECLVKYMSDSSPSFVSFEAFVDAMAIAEGLKRAGHELDREKFVDAIESIHDLDVGLGPQMHLKYGPQDHKGFDGVYPTVIRGGKPIIFTGWNTVTK